MCFLFLYGVNMKPKYKRIILKISGEALSGGGSDVFDFDIGVTSFDCSERIEVKEDVSPAGTDGAGEGTTAFLPRRLNDELID